MTHQLTINYDDHLLTALGCDPTDFAEQARFIIAAKLYELRKLSSGQAASFSGMARSDFLAALPEIGVPASNMTLADLQDELSFAHGE